VALGEIKPEGYVSVELLCPCSTVVEHLTQNLEIMGLSHSGTGRNKTLEYYVSVELLSPF
jgi:hypothetical protein